MTIYTSYYGNLRNINIDKCISISRSCPVPMIRMLELAPSAYTLSLKNDRSKFIDSYLSELLRLDPKYIVDKIYELVGDGAILLCYEKSEFCHRHIVAEWIRQSLPVDVKEVDR